MGWTSICPDHGYTQLVGQPPGEGYTNVPHYSTDLTAAWRVVEQLNRKFFLDLTAFFFDLTNFSSTGKWQATFMLQYADSGEFFVSYSSADTPELAICRAALRVSNEFRKWTLISYNRVRNWTT